MIQVVLETDNYFAPPPPELTFVCRRYRSSVFGGPTSAEIAVSGPEHALWATLEWLRRPVKLRNGAGVVVWSGYIQEIELQIGTRLIGLSLEKMANRVRVAYAERAAHTGLERKTSVAVEDAASIARYGIKEALASMGVSTQARAEAKAAEILGKTKLPVALQTFSGDAKELTATFYAAGWIDTLRWRYYQRTSTRVALEGKSTGLMQPIGWQLESADIVFSRNAGITDFQARLGGLASGVKIQVAGSARPENNVEFTVVRPTTDERKTYTATTIHFDPSDDIFDNAKGFGFVRNNAIVRISGSLSNNGIFEIDGIMNAGYVTVSGGAIVTEGTGRSVTIEQGHEIGVTPVPLDSLTTAGTRTITLIGYRLAQSFVASFGGDVGQIGIVVGKFGEPADALRVSLCADTAGAPGTILGSVEIAGNDLVQDAEWTWFKFTASRPVVVSGATYWLLVERTGANSPDHYYNVATTNTERGVCLAHNGITWVTNPTKKYLPYQVWQAEETTVQLRKIIADAGQFITATTIAVNSGIFDNPEAEGDVTAYDLIETLFDAGIEGGGSFVLQINHDRVARLSAKPAKPVESEAPRIYTLDGQVLTPGGTQYSAEGELPVGEWVAIERTPRHLNLSPVYVEAAEFDAERGTITITPEGNK